MKKLSAEAIAAGLIIEKWIEGYCYPRNGNAHNPTPRILWLVKDMTGRTLATNHRRSDAVEIAEALAQDGTW